MAIIQGFGIYLPNGRFLPNMGDGHIKNALRFAWDHPNLNQMIKDSKEDADDVFIEGGCLIVAGYRGVFYIKIAKDNTNALIKEIASEYKKSGYTVQDFWKINPIFEECINQVVSQQNKMYIMIV